MRSLRKKRAPLTLQLTSLLDMFTIILVFLLQSFQAEDENFTMQAGLELPVSDARNPFTKAVNIAVLPDGVLVEGAKVYPLSEGGKADSKDLEAGTVKAILDAVAEARTGQGFAEGEDVVATIQADQDLPYDTIDLVMRSAAEAGCYRFRLVIEKSG